LRKGTRWVNYLGPFDGAVHGEHVAELVVGDGAGDVSHVQLPRHHPLRCLHYRHGGGHPQRNRSASRPQRRDGAQGEKGGGGGGGEAPAEAVKRWRGYEGGNGGRHW
jgi:hypothetical protein